MSMISASLFTIKVIAHRAINTPAIDLFCFKLSLRNVATRHTLDPLRDGSEKDGGFPHQARPTKHGLLQMIAAYETMHSTPKGKSSAFSGTLRSRRAGDVAQYLKAEEY
jgi:hypothetical protein